MEKIDPRTPAIVPADLTLRDYFAAAALQGLVADHQSHPIDFDDFATTAYAHADAMVAARERKSAEPPPSGRRFL